MAMIYGVMVVTDYTDMQLSAHWRVAGQRPQGYGFWHARLHEKNENKLL